MATRWEVTKAVRRSELPAPARLVMLTLADVAEVGTAEIPERWTPSLTVLARETGLSKRTVQRHLDLLDEEGWIKREKPGKKAQWYGERVRYTLLCPMDSVSTPPVSESREGMDTETRVWSESPGGVVRESTTYGHSDHPNQISSDQSDPSSSRTATQEETKEETTPKKRAKKPEPQRDDVAALCTRLADHIEANTGERPEINESWKTAARLLLDKDKRDLDKALALIDWCQNDEFWRTNILSMKTFRKQYTQLRLKARAEWEKNHRKATPQGPASTAPKRVAADQKCEEHRRPLPCGLCRSEQVGKKKTHAA